MQEIEKENIEENIVDEKEEEIPVNPTAAEPNTAEISS